MEKCGTEPPKAGDASEIFGEPSASVASSGTKRPREEILRENYPSKSAYKKALKDRKKLETKLFRKEQRKKEQAIERERKKEERLKEKLSPEEIEERRKKSKERVANQRKVKQERIEKFRKALSTAPTVVIDLEFGELMTESERRSLAHQLMHCYAMNKKSEKPCNILLSGLDGIMCESTESLSGFENWEVRRERKGYIEAVSEKKDDLVYLTADAEDVIDTFDPSKLYIIGGLVDRNRHKGVCKKKAEDQGIATGRLPIQDHVK